MLFGRASEEETAREWLQSTRAGRGGTLVVMGEPGIGKSALASAWMDQAGELGMRVAIGRAWEVGVAPAFWPWSQALAELEIELDRTMGAALGTSGSDRLIALDRVVRALRSLSRRTPVLIVLDDLHAADLGSLELALAVARVARREAIALVATTREAELSSIPAHAELMARLSREGRTVRLERLSDEAVAAWLQREGYRGDAGAVARLTEGNPLFVSEALRLGADRFATAAAGGTAVVLREHFARLDARTSEILSAASVFGRRSALDDVAAVLSTTTDEVDGARRQGIAVGVLSEANDLVFSHVLLRDTLYSSLPPSRRAELHARALSVLRAKGSTLAVSHALAAGDLVATSEVIDEVARVAQADLRRHAYESVDALVAATRDGLGARLDDRALLKLDLLAAESAMRSGRGEVGRGIAVSCADRAMAQRDADAQVRAALLYGMELMSGRLDDTMIRLLRAALAVVGEGPSLQRARLLARLAAALVPPPSEEQFRLAQAYAEEATRTARALGDPETLLFVLRFSNNAIGYMCSSEERYRLTDEIVQLARALGDDQTLVNVGAFCVARLVEDGRPAAAHEEADTYCALVERIAPAARWRALVIRSTVAALEGELELGYRLAAEAKESYLSVGARSALQAWGHMQLALALVTDTRRLREIDAELVGLFEKSPALAPWLACMHALMGRTDEARRALATTGWMPRGYPWLMTSGEAAVRLEDRAVAAQFYPLLLADRHAGTFFWGTGVGFPLGPTSRVLGELALLLGRSEEARAHLEQAISECTVSNAVLHLARARAALERVGEAPRPPSSRVERSAVTLRREGDAWALCGDGAARFRVKHTKGLDYLATLLAEPGREHHVLTLVGATEGAEDAGPMLDEQAKSELRRRLEDLDDQLAEGERLGDPVRADRARHELDAIAGHLAGAVGLGGRDRKAASNVERARINVQRRIKDAIRRVAERDAELGRYLEATVRTGTYCAYAPV